MFKCGSHTANLAKILTINTTKNRHNSWHFSCFSTCRRIATTRNSVNSTSSGARNRAKTRSRRHSLSITRNGRASGRHFIRRAMTTIDSRTSNATRSRARNRAMASSAARCTAKARASQKEAAASRTTTRTAAGILYARQGDRCRVILDARQICGCRSC